MDSIIRIGWQNELASMTLSSSVSAEANHPLGNITSQIKGKPARWDMAGLTSLTIKGTSATEFTVNSLIMKGHNFGSDTTVRYRVFSGEDQSGDTLFDSNDTDGADVIYTVIPWGEMIAGIDPWGNYYDPDSNLDTVYSLVFDAVVGKSIQLDLTIPSPTNGIAEIDKLATFFGWSPEHSFERGAVFTIEDDTEQVVTEAGGIRATKRPARRRMDLDFAYVKDAYRNRFMHILEKATKAGDLYVIANPQETGYSKYISTSIFRRENNASYEAAIFNGSNMPARLREN